MSISTIKKFDEEWLYFYEALFKKIFKKNFTLKGYLLLLSIWLAVSIAVSKFWMSDVVALLPDWWLYVGIYSLTLSVTILFLDMAKKKLKNNLNEILSLMPNKDLREMLLQKIFVMGNPRFQIVFCVPFSVFVFLVMIYQQVDLVIQDFLFVMSICGIILNSITAVGIWIAGTSFWVTWWLAKRDNLALDFIKPSQTNGILKISEVMSFFATLYSINVLFWNISYLYLTFSAPEKIPFWKLDGVTFFMASGVFIALFIFLFWYFLHPQLLIVSNVAKRKRLTLSKIQKRIKELYESSGEVSSEKLDALQKYLSLYKEIETAQQTLPVYNFIGFGASFLSSLALSVFGNIQTYMTLFS
jgi:hypothetical protein